MTLNCNGAAGIRAPREQDFAFHNDAVRSHVGIGADIGSIKHDGIAGDCSARADPDVIDLKDSVFEGVGLKMAGDRRTFFEIEHIGIDDLGEASAEDYVAADSRTHRPEVPVEQERSF